MVSKTSKTKLMWKWFSRVHWSRKVRSVLWCAMLEHQGQYRQVQLRSTKWEIPKTHINIFTYIVIFSHMIKFYTCMRYSSYIYAMVLSFYTQSKRWGLRWGEIKTWAPSVCRFQSRYSRPYRAWWMLTWWKVCHSYNVQLMMGIIMRMWGKSSPLPRCLFGPPPLPSPPSKSPSNSGTQKSIRKAVIKQEK